MKKSLILILAIVFSCGLAVAKDNPLRLKSGSLTPLKGKGGSIHCVIDFSKTRANRKPLEQYILEDFYGDMDTFHRYEPEMLQWFSERWDDDIEKGPKTTTSENADFQLKIIIKTLQMGSKSGSGGSSISGYAEFYKTGETEPFAVVEILKMNGTIMGSPVPSYPGLKQCLSDLAEYLCDLIYHSK